MQVIDYCFDLSNKNSFNNIESFWLKEVEKFVGNKLKPVCLGLKSDITRVIDFGIVIIFVKHIKWIILK